MSQNTPARLSFAELSEPEGGEFDALLRLYQHALPARERKSTEALKHMVASPDYRIVAARCSGGLTGFAILLIGRTMSLLEYMAVDELQRGRGIGSSLYRRCRDVALPATLPLLIEVDSEREEAADRLLRMRRKDFYLRLGCKQIIGLDYILPLDGTGPPPMMDLLVDGEMLGAFASRQQIAAWLREIYVSTYDCTPDDSRLLAMIGSLPEEVPLR